MLIITKLDEIVQRITEVEEIDFSILNDLISEASKYEDSWSGSVLGYHSNVYYRDFQKPPVGCYFNPDFGIQSELYLSNIGLDSVGDWVEYRRDVIRNRILNSVDEQKMDTIIDSSNKIRDILDECRGSILSIIHSQNISSKDSYLSQLIDEVDKFVVFKYKDYEKSFLKKFSGEQYTRDSRLLSGKIFFSLPEHQIIICKANGICSPFYQKNELIKLIKKIQEHFKNMELIMIDKEMVNKFNMLNDSEKTIYNIGSVQNMANHNSGDYLQQSVSHQSLSVFDEIKSKIRESNEDKEIIKDLISIIEEMDKNKSTNEYKTSYGKFIETIGKSTNLLNSIMELIPKLGNYLP